MIEETSCDTIGACASARRPESTSTRLPLQASFSGGSSAVDLGEGEAPAGSRLHADQRERALHAERGVVLVVKEHRAELFGPVGGVLPAVDVVVVDAATAHREPQRPRPRGTSREPSWSWGAALLHQRFACCPWEWRRWYRSGRPRLKEFRVLGAAPPAPRRADSRRNPCAPNHGPAASRRLRHQGLA